MLKKCRHRLSRSQKLTSLRKLKYACYFFCRKWTCMRDASQKICSLFLKQSKHLHTEYRFQPVIMTLEQHVLVLKQFWNSFFLRIYFCFSWKHLMFRNVVIKSCDLYVCERANASAPFVFLIFSGSPWALPKLRQMAAGLVMCVGERDFHMWFLPFGSN